MWFDLEDLWYLRLILRDNGCTINLREGLSKTFPKPQIGGSRG